MKFRPKLILYCLCVVFVLMVTVVYAKEDNNVKLLDTEITVFYDEDEKQGVRNTEGNVLLNETQNLMTVSSALSISSQIKINGVTVNEQGVRIIDNANMFCAISVSNSSVEDDSVTIIFATYTNEGRLYNTRTFKIDVGAGQTNSMEFMYQFDADKEYKGNLMFWNKFSNIIPIRAAIDFSQTSGINAYYYNADNRLLQIDKANGKSIIFSYDNMGNLLSKTTRE